MARVTKTSYFCDGCGAEVEKRRDLRKFRIEVYNGSWVQPPVLVTDLCETCDAKLLDQLVEFLPTEDSNGKLGVPELARAGTA